MFIKAHKCVEIAPGIWDVHVPIRTITQEESEVLTRLFPDVEDGVGKLLNTQAIISAVASNTEAQAALASQEKKQILSRK